MDSAVDLCVRDVCDNGGDGTRRVKEDVVEKACDDAAEATRRRAVRKFIVVVVFAVRVSILNVTFRPLRVVVDYR